MGLVSKAERSYTEGGVADDLRADGRSRLQYRRFSVQSGVIPLANGSARVRLGGTDVIASVKAELGTPPAGRPGHGHMHVSVDCSATAAPEFQGRGGDELSQELGGALERCLVGGGNGAGASIDPASLGLLDAKVCWVLYIDGLVLSSDGNLLDCLSIAVKAALANTGIPKVEITAGGSEDAEVEVDVEDENLEGYSKLDASRVPVLVTLTKVGKHYIVDATAEEESCFSAAVSVAVNPQGMVTGVTKRNGAGLSPGLLLDMLSVAKQVSQKVIQQVENVTK